MRIKAFPKAIVAVLCAALLSFGLVGQAFGYNYLSSWYSSYSYTDPNYRLQNQGAYNQMGYYFADCYSWSKVACVDRAVGDGAITSWAGITVGNALGKETMYWSNPSTNSGGSGRYVYISASREQSIGYSEGAAAWGYGRVRSGDLAMHDLNSYNIFLITLTDPGPIMSPGEDDGAQWTPGMYNFVGGDGLVYGVPYTDDSGYTAMPDMGRVEATNGAIGYVVVDDMEKYAFEGAETAEEIAQAIERNADIKARALQQTFAEYYGIDALSYETALECVNEIPYEGGMEDALQAVENETRFVLADAIERGAISEDKAFELLGDEAELAANGELPSAVGDAMQLFATAGNIEISADVFNDLWDKACASVAVPAPVYDVDGAVIGEYMVGRA